MAAIVFLPILFIARERPIDTVVFPSPAGVGVIAETRTSFPGGFSFGDHIASGKVLANLIKFNLIDEISNFIEKDKLIWLANLLSKRTK